MSDRRELEERAREAIARGNDALRDKLPPVGSAWGLPVIVDELMPRGAVAIGSPARGVTAIILVDEA